MDQMKNIIEKASKNRNFEFDKESIDLDLSKYHVEKTASTNLNGILDLKYNINEENIGEEKKIHRNPSK